MASKRKKKHSRWVDDFPSIFIYRQKITSNIPQMQCCKWWNITNRQADFYVTASWEENHYRTLGYDQDIFQSASLLKFPSIGILYQILVERLRSFKNIAIYPHSSAKWLKVESKNFSESFRLSRANDKYMPRTWRVDNFPSIFKYGRKITMIFRLEPSRTQ